MGNCCQPHVVETGPGVTSYYVNNGTPQKTSKKKKTNFTQYPGQKRPINDPYVPPESDFTKVDGTTMVATKRFINYRGGNALVLVDDDKSPSSLPKKDSKEYVSVTVPPGLYPGDPMTVATPDGQYLSVTVPEGMFGGSTFLVEFVSGPPPKSSKESKDQSYQAANDDIPIAVPISAS